MATYFIKLYPLGRFFFGSENTFGDNNEENYFVKSMYFPQQTTLLGMIRHQLLIQNDLLDKNGKIFDAKIGSALSLIGDKSFWGETNVEYGIIQKLSPVFINGPDGDYFVQAREYGFKTVEDEYTGEKFSKIVPLSLHHMPGSLHINNQKKDFPSPEDKINHSTGFLQESNLTDINSYYMDHLNSKTVIPDLLVNACNGKMLFFEDNPQQRDDPMNGVFLPVEQVGIRKSEMLPINEKGYYKQVGYQMKDGYSFSFYLELDDKLSLNEIKTYVFNTGITKLQMGADQSWFRMEVNLEKGNIDTKLKEKTSKLFNVINTGYHKVVLLSDAMVDSTIYNLCSFASTDTMSFQYFQTEIAVGRYIKFHKKIKSLQHQLLKKGSVFYCENSDKKEELINNIFNEADQHKAFRKIGYNFYKQTVKSI